MPPLQACGRGWHIASDDLPLPALLGLVFHLAWAIWILVVFIKAGRQLVGCGNAAVSTSATMLLFWAFVITCCVQAWLAYESWQGSVMDESKRRRVPLAVTCLVVTYLLELGSLVYATVVEARLGSVQCYREHEAVHFSAWALIISTWVIAGTGLVLLFLLYNIVPTQSMEGWVDRCRCLGRLPCCWDGLASSNFDADGVPGDPPLIRLARIFGDLFTAVDFTFSDAAAALMLVGLVHKERGHASPMAAVAAAAELAAAAARGMSGSEARGSSDLGSDLGFEFNGQLVAASSLKRPFEPGPKLPPAVAEAAMTYLHLQQQRGGAAAAARAGSGGQNFAKQGPRAAAAGPAEDATSAGRGAGDAGRGPGSTNSRGNRDDKDWSAGDSTGNNHDGPSGSAQDTAGQQTNEGGMSNQGWDDVPLPLLEEALHWHRFANAIYGWPMYLWTRRYRLTFCCGLCCGRACHCIRDCTGCGPGSSCFPGLNLNRQGPGRSHCIRDYTGCGPGSSCFPGLNLNRQGPRPGAPMGVGPQLTREAIVQTAHIPDEDLLHFSLVNKMEGLLPYMVCLDRPRRCVVLAIRGSMSAEDVVTDLLFDPAPLEADWVMAPGQGVVDAIDSSSATLPGSGHPGGVRAVVAAHSHAHAGGIEPQSPTSAPSILATPRTTTSDHLMAAGRTGSTARSSSSFHAAAEQLPRRSTEQSGRRSREQLGRISSRLARAGSGPEEGIDAAHGLSDEALISRAVRTCDVAAGGASASVAVPADQQPGVPALAGSSTTRQAAAAAAAEAAGAPAMSGGSGQAAAAQGDDKQQDSKSATKDKWYAHGAILSSARCIKGDLGRTGLLDALLLGRHPNAPYPEAAHTLNPADPGAPVGVRSSSGGDKGSIGQTSMGSSGAGGTSSGRYSSAGSGSSKSKADGVVGDGSTSEGMPDCRGWTLLVTGHSLGAGVAALLAMHLRTQYPNVRCWCFAPPGGLLSPAAAASLDDICHTLISAKDMIPRLSLWTVEKLRDEMMLAALRCKVPKVNLLVSGLFGKRWTEATAMMPLDQMPPAKWEQYKRYAVRVEKERSLDPLRVCIAREMIPPGRVIWLERHKGPQPSHLHTNASDSAAHAPHNANAGPAQYAVLRRNSSGWTNGSGGGDAGDSNSNWSHAGSNASAAAANGEGTRGLQADGAHPGDSSGSNIVSVPLLPSLPSLPLLPRPWHTPHWASGGSLIVGGVIVSKSMFADHVPDGQYLNFKRMVRQLQKQAATATAPHTSRAAATWRRIGSGLSLHRAAHHSNAPSKLHTAPRPMAMQATDTDKHEDGAAGAAGDSHDAGAAGPLRPVVGAVRGWLLGVRAGAAGEAGARRRVQEQPGSHLDVEMGLGSGAANSI